MIVIGFHESENLDPHVRLGGEGAALEHFVIEGTHNRLCLGVIIGISAGKHALLVICIFEYLRGAQGCRISSRSRRGRRGRVA